MHEIIGQLFFNPLSSKLLIIYTAKLVNLLYWGPLLLNKEKSKCNLCSVALARHDAESSRENPKLIRRYIPNAYEKNVKFKDIY